MAQAAGAAVVPRTHDYETIYILRPNTQPADAEKVSDRVSEVIQRLGGKLTKVDNWGKRKLAYPIKKNTRGVFVYVRYVGPNDLVAELERNLRLLDAVVRFQSVVIEHHVDPDSVEVDPEEVKFLALEVTDDDDDDDDDLGLSASDGDESADDASEDGDETVEAASASSAEPLKGEARPADAVSTDAVSPVAVSPDAVSADAVSTDAVSPTDEANQEEEE